MVALIHIITSNGVPVSGIEHYVDNFMIVHHYTRTVRAPYNESRQKHIFQTYLQPEMEVEEDDFKDTPTLEFHLHEVPLVKSALDEIAAAIYEQWKKERDAGDGDVETMIICACKMSWNRTCVSYLNKRLKARGMDVECMNLYVALRASSEDKLKEIMKSVLGTDFIYPDDPVSFAYAVDRALIGLV